jgi:uncharacterized protein YbjT (DUF2867 family)
MKYLITGATGNIGALVAQRLIDRGERPCVFVRDGAKARAQFGDAVEIRGGDWRPIRRRCRSHSPASTRSFS